MFSKQRWCLFFSMPLDEQDWRNLNVSKVRLVMLPFSLAYNHPDLLGHMAALQKRLILRIDEGELYTTDPYVFRQRLYAMIRSVQVEAVIIGNEPEGGHDMTFSSPNWGQDWAKHHKQVLDEVRVALSNLGAKLISPGWTVGRKREIDPLLPGRIAWRIEVGEEYGRCDGNGGHVYLNEWGGEQGLQNEIGYLNQVNNLCEMYHKPVWLDEVGITQGSDLEQMRAYIRMSDMLLDRSWEAGSRVELFSPFISNGDPYKRDGEGNILKDAAGNPLWHWNPKYLLRDEGAYSELGRYLAA
jgi:hypothetical protein